MGRSPCSGTTAPVRVWHPAAPDRGGARRPSDGLAVSDDGTTVAVVTSTPMGLTSGGQFGACEVGPHPPSRRRDRADRDAGRRCRCRTELPRLGVLPARLERGRPGQRSGPDDGGRPIRGTAPRSAVARVLAPAAGVAGRGRTAGARRRRFGLHDSAGRLACRRPQRPRCRADRHQQRSRPGGGRLRRRVPRRVRRPHQLHGPQRGARRRCGRPRGPTACP